MKIPIPDTIETERLVLRWMRPDDTAAITAIANDWAVAQWMARVPHPYTLNDAQQWQQITDGYRQTGAELAMLIERRSDNAVMGFAGFIFDVREIGYWLGTAYQGQGYATEAASAIIDYVFTHAGHDDVFAVTMPQNNASQRTIQRLGFVADGVRDYDFVLRGGIQPAPYFRLPYDVWQQKKSAV